MSGKQSREMYEALRLVGAGVAIRAAARQAGVHWTSLHTALNRARDPEAYAKQRALRKLQKKVLK